MDKIKYQLYFFALALVLMGCGPVADVSPSDGSLSANQQTGGNKSVITESNRRIQVPYTSADHKDELAQLKAQHTSITDKLLSSQILNVNALVKQSPFAKEQGKPERIDIFVTVNENDKLSLIRFKSELTLSKGKLKSPLMTQQSSKKKPYFYTATAECLNEKCEVIKAQINRLNTQTKDQKTPLASTSFIYSYTQPQIKVIKKYSTQEFKDFAFLNLEKNTDEANAERSTTTVANGASFSKITIPHLLSIETELLDTGEISVDVKKLSIFNNTDYVGQLVGNDPDTGNILLDITSKKTSETLRLKIFNPKIAALDLKKPISNKSPTLFSNAELFKPDLSDKKSDISLTTEQFKNYEKNPVVECMIQKLLKTNEMNCDSKGYKNNFSLEKLKLFLTHTQPIAPYIKLVSEKIAVTPEIGYILILESEYTIDGNYNAKDTPPYVTKKTKDGRTYRVPMSTAYGPWQILDQTANHINSMVGEVKYFLRAGRDQNDLDDRSYLLNSTYMASVYLKYLFNKFTVDPAVAIFAYKIGPGAANGVISKTKKHTQFPITLSEIINYRVQSKAQHSEIQYALSFLVARSIGQNLSKYGLSDLPKTKSTAYEVRLINPHSHSLSKLGIIKSDVNNLNLPNPRLY